MSVPYVFGTATAAIPLSQLDSNFNTTITLGNTAIQLGNTVTTLNNMTLANVTVTSGTSNITSTTISNGTSNVAVASSGGNINLTTAGTTAVTIDTSQNVGIGTSSPGYKLSVVAPVGGGFNMTNGVDSTLRVLLPTLGITYDNVNGGYHAWQTSGTERARIDSSGNFVIGVNSYALSNSNGILLGPVAGAFTGLHASGTVSGSVYSQFAYNGGIIGSITQNGTTGVLYNLTSDYRLKNNPQALTGAKDFVMALQPKKWQWWDGSGEGIGFIAHEFMEVAKYSGNGEKDAVDAEGKPVMQSIQPSSSEVMANLVSFIQEQQALITSLTARITALENK